MQLVIMGIVSGVFFLLDHVIMTWIILGLAVCFALLAVVAPRAYVGKEAFFARFAHKAGVALTHLLLVPFYWICFAPARVMLRRRGTDPMHRAFPAPEKSCWRVRAPARSKAFYRRQY